ncbi:unnamed protein product [Peronospora destructor]|uniref:Uncharacterized protein n=1 Tax=Peronospora destructor TaxID=86335 RepID=A0AAV0UN46_9STRA|nr:unnamed protein product [Peronospora destructor]
MRQPRLRQRELVVIFMLSAILVCSTVARILPTTACEGAAPTLATLRRSANVASAAEVVYHNCTVVDISSISRNGITTIDASNLNIQAVSSFPDVTTVLLSGNQITTIHDDPDATVKTVDLSLNGLTRLNALAIPRTVTELVLDGNSISGLDDGEIPATVTALSLKNNSIMMLKHIFIRQNITQA